MASESVNTDGASTAATDEAFKKRSRDVDWYVKNLDKVPDLAREVLEKYSKIPPEKVYDHVYKVREEAWDVWNFPCLGGWRFLTFNLCTFPEYQEILSQLQQGGKLLDLGCCFGQELRRLIYDGAPAESLYGADLRPEFFDLGYNLFLDRDRCKARFITADIMEEQNALTQLNGRLTVVYASAFFHLWDRPEQIQVAKAITKLLKPEKGSMVLGRQVGNIRPGSYEHGSISGGRMFRHDAQSWRELWDEIGREMGVQWKVEAELREIETLKDNKVREEQDSREERDMMLWFCVRRL